MEDSVLHHLRVYRTDIGFTPQSLPMPTEAPPGTPEKLAVLMARLEAGEQLHHPDDRRMQFPLPSNGAEIRVLNLYPQSPR